MPDGWTAEATATAFLRVLLVCGFSREEGEHLLALRLRYQAGAFRELTPGQNRLLFVRWLVEHGRLSDG